MALNIKCLISDVIPLNKRTQPCSVSSVFFLAHYQLYSNRSSQVPNSKFTMSTEIAVNQDEVVQPINGDDIATNLEFLRAAGLLPPLPLPPVIEGNSDSASTMLGLTEAVKALAKDVSVKMDQFGKRLEAIESRSTPEVLGSAGAPAPSNTSTPAPEVRNAPNDTSAPAPVVQNDDHSTPVHGGMAPLPWAERSVNEVPDYEEVITWPDEEDGSEGNSTKLFSVSENTKTLLQESFLKGVPNATRRQMREKFGDPKCPPTRVPKLDKMVKDRITSESVKLDKSLARLQALCLDAVGPLTTIIDEGDKGNLSEEMAIGAARMALRFIGNASVQFSRERRKRAITEMNSKLIELADKDSIYEDAPPELFGEKFAKEAKEREEQLRCLDKASGRGRGQNFYSRRPQGPSRRGGGAHSSHYGGYNNGRGRFRPYPQKFGNQSRGKENFFPKGKGRGQ